MRYKILQKRKLKLEVQHPLRVTRLVGGTPGQCDCSLDFLAGSVTRALADSSEGRSLLPSVSGLSAPPGSGAGQGLRPSSFLYDGGNRTQRGQVTCLKPHSKMRQRWDPVPAAGPHKGSE